MGTGLAGGMDRRQTQRSPGTNWTRWLAFLEWRLQHHHARDFCGYKQNPYPLICFKRQTTHEQNVSRVAWLVGISQEANCASLVATLTELSCPPSWRDLPHAASVGCSPKGTAIGRYVQVGGFHLRKPCTKEAPVGPSIRGAVNADPCGGVDGVTGGVARVNNDPIDPNVRQPVLRQRPG